MKRGNWEKAVYVLLFIVSLFVTVIMLMIIVNLLSKKEETKTKADNLPPSHSCQNSTPVTIYKSESGHLRIRQRK